MTIFDRIITAQDVREAVVDTIRTWAPAYLGEVAVNSGRDRGALPTFRSYGSTATDFTKFNDQQIPACLVVVPGIVDKPRRNGDGRFDTRWSVGIGVVVAARGEVSTRDLVDLYTAAVRSLVLQQPDLGGFASGVSWRDERYDRVVNERRRTLAGAVIEFAVDVRNTVNANAGPVTVPEDPTAAPGEWPTIDTVIVSTQRKFA